MARQGKVVMKRSCLVTMHEMKVLLNDFWARRGTRGVGEGGLLRDCDTPSSLPSLVSDVSEMKNGERLSPPFSSKEEGWGGVCYSTGKADFMSI